MDSFLFWAEDYSPVLSPPFFSFPSPRRVFSFFFPEMIVAIFFSPEQSESRLLFFPPSPFLLQRESCFSSTCGHMLPCSGSLFSFFDARRFFSSWSKRKPSRPLFFSQPCGSFMLLKRASSRSALEVWPSPPTFLDALYRRWSVIFVISPCSVDDLFFY